MKVWMLCVLLLLMKFKINGAIILVGTIYAARRLLLLPPKALDTKRFMDGH